MKYEVQSISDQDGIPDTKQDDITDKQQDVITDKKHKKRRKWTLIIVFIVLVIISVVIIVLSRLLRFGVWKIVNDDSSDDSGSTSKSPTNNCKDAFCSSQYNICYFSNCTVCSPLRDGYPYYHNVSDVEWSVKPTGNEFYDGGVQILVNDPTGEACKLKTTETKCYSKNDIPLATSILFSRQYGVHLTC